MTKKELKKISRAEMALMLMRQTRKAETLEAENQRLKARLSERERHLTQMGTLAEAILKISGSLSPQERVQAERFIQSTKRSAANGGEEESGGDADSEEDADGLPEMPTADQLEWLVDRDRYRQRYLWSLKTTVYALVTVAAVAILVAVLVMPVLRIYGSSMNPTLTEGNFVLSIKGAEMETGDVVAFYFNNKILVKRVIGQAGQWVDIAEDGTVYVDNVAIEEPYLTERAFGECDIDLPYQVPESRVFVMGDNRSVSVDSRSSSVGCVAEEQLVGKIVFRIWPFQELGPVESAAPGTA